jgi:hypothetical protein
MEFPMYELIQNIELVLLIADHYFNSALANLRTYLDADGGLLKLSDPEIGPENLWQRPRAYFLRRKRSPNARNRVYTIDHFSADLIPQLKRFAAAAVVGVKLT